MKQNTIKASDRVTVRFGSLIGKLRAAELLSGQKKSRLIRIATGEFLSRNRTKAALVKAVIKAA